MEVGKSLNNKEVTTPEGSQSIKKQKTMIVANLKKFKGKERDIFAPEKNKKPRQPDKRRTLEGKLRYLKDLKKQNLITEDAYKKKVEELLDQM